MDKYTAADTISKAGMNTYDIAHSIYLATVKGISGANQNDGYGFALSAVAELWNIRGNVGNPYGKTKITGRYKGMGVTESMIQNIVSQYPNGIVDSEPLFDDLLGIGSGAGMEENYYQEKETQIGAGSDQNVSNIDIIIAIIALVILKFFLGWGWIGSIVVALLIGGVVDSCRRR